MDQKTILTILIVGLLVVGSAISYTAMQKEQGTQESIKETSTDSGDSEITSVDAIKSDNETPEIKDLNIKETGSTSNVDTHNLSDKSDEDSFVCGPDLACNPTTQYCFVVLGGPRGVSPGYQCQDLPADCSSSTCECFSSSFGSKCTESDGDITVITTAP
jgi:hypothetical protein